MGTTDSTRRPQGIHAEVVQIRVAHRAGAGNRDESAEGAVRYCRTGGRHFASREAGAVFSEGDALHTRHSLYDIPLDRRGGGGWTMVPRDWNRRAWHVLQSTV